VPGCGCYPVREANWYEWFEQKLLTQHADLFSEVILENMPDPIIAHENIWCLLFETLSVQMRIQLSLAIVPGPSQHY
jgi:hypothetical protein